jgi:hypothetical protein
MKLLTQNFSANGVLKGTVIAIKEDGTPMGFEEVITLSDSKQRQRLAQKLADEFSLPLDDTLQVVRNLLIQTRTTANQVPEELPTEGAKPESSAKFPGLIDLVDDGAGPKFLVLEEGNPIPRDRVIINETAHVPPPMDAIQWLLPRSSDVIASYVADSDYDIYLALKSYFKKVSQLPTESHYALLALWTIHTYLLEHFSYSPYLLLWAVPERGKSRTARAATYAAYRGLVTETLQEANLFRWSNDLGVSLAFDVRDLWRKAEKRGSDDILLQRFEKGAKVARVLWPERGKFKDTAYFDVFGASIIAANEMPGEPFISRCVVVTMPEAAASFANNIGPADGLPLRERLVALRARWLNNVLPDAAKPAPGRLGDILQPFAQVAALLGPDVRKEFSDLAKMLNSERMEDRASSREARMVSMVEAVWDIQEDWKIGVEQIASQYNLGLSDKQQISNETAGRRLSALGFQKARLKDTKRAIVADDAILEALKFKYGLKMVGLGGSQEVSELSEPSVDAQPEHCQFSDSSPGNGENRQGNADSAQELSENRQSVSQAQNRQFDSSDSSGEPPEDDINCDAPPPEYSPWRFTEDL